MRENTPVFETERLERAYLRLFLCGQPLHGRYHSQDRDKQKQRRQDGAHGFALIALAFRLSISRALVF